MKKIIKDNYRVIVEPTRSFRSFYSKREWREEQNERVCESIVEELKRHVDEVGSTEIVFDTEEICEFCNREWEVYDEDGEEDGVIFYKDTPVCCTEAVTEHLMQREKEEIK